MGFAGTMEVTVSAYCLKLVVLLAINLSTAITTPLCPSGCECFGGAPATSLTVDCHGNPVVDRGQLSRQLDSLLSSNLSYGHLTTLSITRTPLTHVPRSVCRLTTLTQLHLDYNRLTRLPDNCFTNLTALTSLAASENNIAQLQDGIFDGLQKLVTLWLGDNRISSIGLRVFNGSAMLTSLRSVTLKGNRLQTLEPWFYYVGINGLRAGRKSYIDIGHNNISTFTNRMGWKAKCGMKKVYVSLDLQYNHIRHVSDILHGWNMTILMYFCLRSSRIHYNNFHIDIDYNKFMECDCVDFDIYKLVLSGLLRTRLLANNYCGKPYSLHLKRVTSIPLDQFVCELTESCPFGCRCVHRPANVTLHIYCSNANLTDLPQQLPELPKSYTKYKLDFSNNPLLRRLEYRHYIVNSWMPDWLKSVQGNLLNPNDVTCSSPSRLKHRNIMSIGGEVFCADPASEAVKRALKISISSVVGVVILLMSVGVFVYRLRVRLYTRWKFHPFDRDECLGEDLDFDVFLSCSSNDNLPRGNAIREKLEERGYRVCYPPRDFVAGEPIHDNIYNAVVRSKRTVCFLTPQFLQRFVVNSFVCVLAVYKDFVTVLLCLYVTCGTQGRVLHLFSSIHRREGGKERGTLKEDAEKWEETNQRKGRQGKGKEKVSNTSL